MTKKKGPFQIYIDRLKDDDTESIHEITKTDFLDTQEEELSFSGDAIISGQAYLAKNHLILDLKIKLHAILPCSICNKQTEIPIEIDDFTHTQELCEVPSAIYDYTEDLRAAILLKIPRFIECHHGHCPSRKEINKYLNSSDRGTHSPFSDLDL